MQYSQLQLEEPPISPVECLALAERVAASQEFRRASRMREFLLFVCSQSLQHGASGLHEQEIGEAVFGRPASYDTNVDNIVRVNATGLRKRLEQYFADEGSREPVVLEIPRGSYAPVFRRRAIAAVPENRPVPSFSNSALDFPPPPSPPALSATPVPRRVAWFWPGVAAILLALCTTLLWHNRSLERQLQRWKAEPSLRAFWGEFFQSGGPSGDQTDIVLADTSFALAEDILRQTISLNDYVNYSYKRLADDNALPQVQRDDLRLVLARNNGSVGDFQVAQQILSLDADPHRTTLKFARDYTTDAAKHNNLVLIGSQESNPWVALFADKLNFAFQYDPVLHRTLVVNRTPHAGEPPTWSPPAPPNPPNTGYGVIAYLPSLSGKGKTLILEGTDSQATGAAGEFMTSEDALASFAAKFPAGPIPSFEILLRTSQLSGTPLHAEIVAYRIYANGQRPSASR